MMHLSTISGGSHLEGSSGQILEKQLQRLCVERRVIWTEGIDAWRRLVKAISPQPKEDKGEEDSEISCKIIIIHLLITITLRWFAEDISLLLLENIKYNQSLLYFIRFQLSQWLLT